eukprot:6390803-Lingulodinium_polyedra.AAC.1
MAEERGISRSTEGVLKDLRHKMYASATDWIVELMGGIQFRYTRPSCKLMPIKSCRRWRISHAAGLGGSSQQGAWAMP